MRYFPDHFLSLLFILCAIGQLSSSSKSIHISSFCIFFLNVSHNIILGLMMVKNSMECSLWSLNL